jgi:AcrR family transcriptional regulator
MAPGTTPADVAAPSTSTRTDAVRAKAAHLFETQGYAATTMNDIADAAGMLPGSLYHHFASKEDIAIELLMEFDRALDDLGESSRLALARSTGVEDSFRSLTARMQSLSFAHAAAVRLRAHKAPPTASSPRFTQAMSYESASLDRAWRDAVMALRPVADRSVDLGLLAYAMNRVTMYAPIYHPSTRDSDEMSDHMCEIVLHGLLASPVGDDELDHSPGAEAADAAIAAWPPRDDTPTDDKARILAAARAEFARRGYDATTIRDIATAAGIGTGTLYRKVESKEALLAQIVDTYAADFGTALQTVLAADGTEPQVLDGVARVFVHANRHFRDEARIVIYGWSQREATSSPLHEYYMATEQRLAQFQQLMRRGVEHGRLRDVAGYPDAARYLRAVLWQPFQDMDSTGEAATLAFLRNSLLRGVVRQD